MSESTEASIGRMLAQARQVKGLSTADVAEKLKLTSRQIEALEADEYDKLPAAVFVRGFVRNYARLVGLNPDHVLAAMGESQGASTTITAPSEGVTISVSPLKRWMIYFAGGFLLFLLLVALLYQWLSSGEEAFVSEVTPPALQAAQTVTPSDAQVMAAAPVQAAPAASATTAAGEVASGPAPVPVATLPLAPAQPAATPVTVPAAPVVPAEGPTMAPPSAPAVAGNPYLPQSGARAQAGEPVAASGQSMLRFSAQDESWLQVVDAAGKRSSQLLTRGASASVAGTPPFRVVIGNAGVVSLRYNDQNIDLRPFTGDKVARLTLE
jgi:cytoskeleton protein RodZ